MKERPDRALRAPARWRRATRVLALTIAVALVVVAPLRASAQAPSPPQPGSPVVRIAKWTLLAAAVGLGAYALQRSTDAADAYDALRALCLDAPGRCAHGGGEYADVEAEALYDRALAADRQAKIGIYTGEAALIGSVAMFIIDLRAGDGPPTIPFPGRSGGGARIVLARIAF